MHVTNLLGGEAENGRIQVNALKATLRSGADVSGPENAVAPFALGDADAVALHEGQPLLEVVVRVRARVRVGVYVDAPAPLHGGQEGAHALLLAPLDSPVEPLNSQLQLFRA